MFDSIVHILSLFSGQRLGELLCSAPVFVPGRGSGVGLLAHPIRSRSGASGVGFLPFPAFFACSSSRKKAAGKQVHEWQQKLKQ